MADDPNSSNKPNPPRPGGRRSAPPPAPVRSLKPSAPPRSDPASSPVPPLTRSKAPPPPMRSRPSGEPPSAPSRPPLPPQRQQSADGTPLPAGSSPMAAPPAFATSQVSPGLLKTQVMGTAAAMTVDATTSFQLLGATPIASLGSVQPEPRIGAARELLQAFRAELGRKPPPLRAGRLHFEIARLLECPLGELEAAAEAYRQASALLPAHLPSLRGARRLTLALGQAPQAIALFDAEIKLTAEPERKAQLLYEKASVLEDLLDRKKEAREAFEASTEIGRGDPSRIKGTQRAEHLARRWDELERALEREANAITADGRHRAAIVSARARLLEARRSDPATAAELYQRAIDSDPHAASALHALKRLHYGHQRWRDLISVLEREAALATDPGVRALAHYAVGRTWLDRLGTVAEGIAALERAAAESPSDRMILQELARAYELGKRPAELAGVLERLSENESSTAERISHFQRIAELYETELRQEAKAIDWYERARALDPTHVPLLQALSKLYTQNKDFTKLAAVHAGEAERVQDPARRAAAYARIADIYEVKLGQPEEAAQQHARALGVLPGYAPSFKALARLLTQARKYTELVELYERTVDRAPDKETKVTYLFKIGRLYEDALTSPEQALVAYKRILDVDPDEMGAVHALQRSAERSGLYQELIAALELEAARTSDRSRKLALHHRAGEVAEVELGNEALAIQLFQKVVELDKSYSPVYASLGRLFYKAGRWDELIETYKSELRLVSRGPGLAALLYKMGQLYEDQLGRDEEAVQSYRRAVEADPAHRSAIRALERKLGEKNLWDELVKLLETELGVLTDPKLKARAALRIGEVYENRLRNPGKALQAYELALSTDPELTPASDGRVRLLTEAKDYPALVEQLRGDLEMQRDARAAVSALLRIGEVYRDDLTEPASATSAFEAVLQRDPSQVEALLALESLYAEGGDWDGLANIYATQARVLSDAGARVGALRELGRLQSSGRAPSQDEGRQAFGAILQLAPGDFGALFALERIALRQDDLELLAHVDANLAATLSDAISVAAHETRLGELLEAANDPQALDVYRAALARDPESIAAARGMGRIAERVGDATLLEEAAEREAHLSVDPSRAASVLLRAAERQLAAGDAQRAAQALVRALELDPDHERVASRLGELLTSRGEIDRLLSVLTQAAGAATNPERVAALWIAVAELQAARRNDLPAALAALHRALGLLPRHIPSLMMLGDLYARDGQWREAIDRWKQALAEKPGAETAREAHLRLAHAMETELDDTNQALYHLQAVLQSDPSHRAALERLVSIEAARGQLDAAAETAARLVRVSPESTTRVAALTLLARLERQRGQHEAAVHSYEQAVVLVGLDGPAAAEMRELLSTPRPSESPAFGRYVGALSRYVDNNARVAAAVYLEIARTLAARMNQGEQAIGWLERGLAVHPTDVALRSELAESLLAAGKAQAAFVELGRVLAADVERPAAWRQLAEALQRMQRPADAALAIAPLIALGSANDLERSTWSSRASHAAQAAPGAFGEEELIAIALPPVHDAAARLLASLGDIAGKVNPPELDRWGVSGRDRLSSKSGHPLRVLAERVGAIFGSGDFDLYVHRAHSGQVEVELTDPISVLVPSYVAGLSEPEQTFLLGRVLANVGRGFAAVDRLSPSALETLLSAAARLVDPSYGAPAADEEYLASQARRVAKALPWLGRGPIEDAARTYAQAPRVDIGEWALAVRLTAARAACVLADDLPSSISLVRRLEGDLSGAEGLALAVGTRTVHDLLRFWVSDPASTLRRRLGFT